MKKQLFLLLLLLSFKLTAQINFNEQTVTENPQDAALLPTATAVGDIDGDGDEDIVGVSYHDFKLFWYQNDGSGNFGTQILIDTRQHGIPAVELADVNGDNHLDVIISVTTTNELLYYLNDGSGNFGNAVIIDTGNMDYIRDIEAADFDNDGDTDIAVVSLLDNKVAWYINTDGQGTFSTIQVLANDVPWAYHIDSGDIDNDGDLDLVVTARTDHEIIWFENTDGHGTFATKQVIVTGVYSNSVELGDMDNDGDLDMVYRDDNYNTSWLENNGTAIFSNVHIIISNFNPFVVELRDMDNDGDLDIVTTNLSDLKYIENHNNGTQFIEHPVIQDVSGTLWSFCLGNLNNDVYPDIVSVNSSNNDISVFMNTGVQTFTNPVRITPDAYQGSAIVAGDFSGMGQNSIIAGFNSQAKLSAFYNNSFIENIIDTQKSIKILRVGDIDNDGDEDVLYLDDDHTFGWFENQNGNFVSNSEYDTNDWNQYILIKDIDNDNDIDVITFGYFFIEVWKNNGHGGFSSQQFIPQSYTSIYYITGQLIDMNNDGYDDILVYKKNSQELVWYAYNPNTTLFDDATENILASNINCNYIEPIDIDNDNDMDFLLMNNAEVLLYTNNGNGYTSSVFDNKGYSKIIQADIDGDNDLDLIGISNLNPVISYYENTGSGFNTIQTIANDISGLTDIYAIDYDQDGDNDLFVISAFGKVIYFENTTTNGVVAFETRALNIYPNPVNDMLYIDNQSGSAIAKVEIYSIEGQLINVLSNTTDTIDVSHLQKGLYLIKVYNTEDQVNTYKIIKQ